MNDISHFESEVYHLKESYGKPIYKEDYHLLIDLIRIFMLLEIVRESEVSWRVKCHRANADQKKVFRGYVLPPFSPRMNYPETRTYLSGSDKLYSQESQ